MQAKSLLAWLAVIQVSDADSRHHADKRSSLPLRALYKRSRHGWRLDDKMSSDLSGPVELHVGVLCHSSDASIRHGRAVCRLDCDLVPVEDWHLHLHLRLLVHSGETECV
eukprot:763937-Hanusia_phi.AAC.10